MKNLHFLGILKVLQLRDFISVFYGVFLLNKKGN